MFIYEDGTMSRDRESTYDILQFDVFTTRWWSLYVHDWEPGEGRKYSIPLVAMIFCCFLDSISFTYLFATSARY